MAMRRGVLFSPLINGLLVILAVVVMGAIFSGQIKSMVKTILGSADEGTEDLIEVPQEEFQQQLTAVYNNCGIGSTQQYCKCTVPMNIGEKKVYLRGQGEGRTLMSFFFSDDPEVSREGNLDVDHASSPAHFGPLCLHFKEGGILGDPFLPPMPELEQFGILFYREGQKLTWAANAGDHEGSWSAEPAIFFRAGDQQRCLWLPRVVDPLFGEAALVNEVPECDASVAAVDIAAAQEEFIRFKQMVDNCLTRTPAVPWESCSSYAFSLPPGIEIQQHLADPVRPEMPRARSLVLVVNDQKVNTAEYPKGVALCSLENEREDFATRAIRPTGVILIKEKGTLCFSQSTGLAEQHAWAFDSRISDAQYLSKFINAQGTAHEREDRWDDLVLQYAKQQNVDFWLLKAIIQQESVWDAAAISGAGSTGLMQVTPKTAEELAEGGLDCPSPFAEPENNIRCGIVRLKQLMQYTKEQNLYELRHLLAGYNGGEEALAASEDCPGLQKWECEWEDPSGTPERRRNEGPDSYAQTREYVPKVIGYYEAIA